MNIQFTNEQKMLQYAIRKFAKEVCEPIAGEIDKEHRFPRETFNKLSERGYIGVGFPTEYGGTGFDKIGQVIVIEELAKVCAATSSVVSIHQAAAMCISNFGTKEQKDKYLKKLICDGVVAAFALTEPNAGSDASNLQTTAVLDGDDYILNGTKCFITGAGEAEVCIVLALTDPAKKTRGITGFIVTSDMPGFSFGKIEEKMGIRASSTGEIVFDNVRVPKENMIGKYNEGFKLALAGIDTARVLVVGAQALGIAEGALDYAVDYANTRVQFGKPVSANQGLQWYFAEMATKIEATRWLVYATAQMIQDKTKFSKEAAMVKLFASETAIFVTDKALQILGGYGYMNDYPVERMSRDARITAIYEGTNEIQKLVISRAVLK